MARNTRKTRPAQAAPEKVATQPRARGHSCGRLRRDVQNIQTRAYDLGMECGEGPLQEVCDMIADLARAFNERDGN